MSVEERDPYTGHMTTGHSWNGIKELNTRVPPVLLFFLLAAFIFAVAYTVLLPSWPGVDSFYRGTLDTDQRVELGAELAVAAEARKPWVDRLLSTDIAAIAEDKELLSVVATAGPALFRDNCAGCHGQQGEGSLNFPALNDASWLWERSADSIHKTLQVGINANREGTRIAQMPAFGDQKTLDSTEIKQVSLYVSSFSTPSIGDGSNAAELLQVNQGRKLFAANCAACHGGLPVPKKAMIGIR